MKIYQYNNTKPSTDDSLLEMYMEMQSKWLTEIYNAPASIEFIIRHQLDNYFVDLIFETKENYSIQIKTHHWSPFKAIEKISLMARDEILKRAYEQHSYA